MCHLPQVPEGHVVMLSFRLFDMEADPTCRYDYLDVYNGHSRLVQKLGRFCGTFRPGALISTSNTMMLDMVSDEATGGRGFLAAFAAGKPHVEGVHKRKRGHDEPLRLQLHTRFIVVIINDYTVECPRTFSLSAEAKQTPSST